MQLIMQSTGLAVVQASKVFTTPAETIRAVDSVSFTANPGDFICIHGSSGSGKTTLLNLIAGIEAPDSGDILTDGISMRSLTDGERVRLRLDRIGVVFQHDNLIEEFTAAENIAFPLELRRYRQAAIDAEVTQLLGRVGLSDMGTRMPHQLSGGQQQRVGVARALAGGRGLLVCDEPTAALDSANSEALFALFAELAAQEVAVILASHDPLARRFATRTVEMIDGTLHD